MKKITFEDANGKKFTASIQDIMDFAQLPGMNIQDSTDNEDSEDIPIDFTPVILDAEGTSIPFADIMDAKKSNIKFEDIIAIDVTYEATHSGRNKNYAIYTSDSMSEDCHSFVRPFPKPFIKNHDLRSEPMGRAKAVEFRDQSRLVQDRSAIDVTWRITDKDGIRKHLDGTYLTMSIGATAHNVTCNVCGHKIIKDGQYNKFCGHWRGEKYKDTMCYWTSESMEYREGSVVNSPADMYAQVVKIQIITKDNQDGTTDSADGEDNFMDNLDSVIGGEAGEEGTQAGNNTDEGSTEGQGSEGSEAGSEGDNAGANDGSGDTDGASSDGDDGSDGDSGSNDDGDGDDGGSDGDGSGESEDAYKEKYEQLQKDNEALQTENDALKTENQKLTTKVSDQDKTINTLTSDLSTKTDEVTKLQDAAKTNRTMLVDFGKRLRDELVAKAAGYMVNYGDAKDFDEAKDSLVEVTSKEIESKIKDYEARPGSTRFVKVNNPGVSTDHTNGDTTTKSSESANSANDILDNLTFKMTAGNDL